MGKKNFFSSESGGKSKNTFKMFWVIFTLACWGGGGGGLVKKKFLRMWWEVQKCIKNFLGHFHLGSPTGGTSGGQSWN